MATGPNDRFADGYDAHDFGADHIIKYDDWKGSGYTHYVAHSDTGGTVSWNEAETEDERIIANPHMTDKQSRDDPNFTVWD